jgi:hypothetical protein
MSEEFDLLNVTVHRVQVDNVVIKVPKGWKPVLWELREIMPQVFSMWISPTESTELRLALLTAGRGITPSSKPEPQ